MKTRFISLLLAIGLVAFTSACASKAKSAEGPESAKGAEQKSEATSPEASSSATAAAEGNAAPSTENEAAPAAPESASPEAGKAVDLSTFEIVHFKFDKYDILPEYRDGLAKEAETLKSDGAQIVIEGHCDERGTEEYNMALGERRANAVKKYWVSLGVDEKQLGTISYGEERPVDPGHNEEAWHKNRRAQFTLAK